jgi:hypothetical protein
MQQLVRVVRFSLVPFQPGQLTVNLNAKNVPNVAYIHGHLLMMII